MSNTVQVRLHHWGIKKSRPLNMWYERSSSEWGGPTSSGTLPMSCFNSLSCINNNMNIIQIHYRGNDMNIIQITESAT